MTNDLKTIEAEIEISAFWYSPIFNMKVDVAEKCPQCNKSLNAFKGKAK